MLLIKAFWDSLRRVVAPRPFEAELAADLRVHLDRLIAYNRRLGMTPEQATAAARRRLGVLALRMRR